VQDTDLKAAAARALAKTVGRRAARYATQWAKTEGKQILMAELHDLKQKLEKEAKKEGRRLLQEEINAIEAQLADM
jgi:hypothetical protein